jgi:hypothetical protein
MKIKIEFNTDNAAFDDEALTDECSDVFRACLEHIKNPAMHVPTGTSIFQADYVFFKLADSNGNKIGMIEIYDIIDVVNETIREL